MKKNLNTIKYYITGELTSVAIYRETERDRIAGILIPGENDDKNKAATCALQKTAKGFGFIESKPGTHDLSAAEFKLAHYATFSDKDYCNDPTNSFELKLEWSVNYEDPNYSLALKEDPKYEIKTTKEILIPMFKGISLYQYMVFMVKAAGDYYNFDDWQIDQEQFYILTKAGYVKNQLENLGYTAYIEKGEVHVKKL